MEDKRFERKDIELRAENPWLMLGDFYYARILSIVASKDRYGVDTYKIRIVPSKELAKMYNITLEMLDEDNRSIIVEYPKQFVRLMNPDPSYTVWFCFLNFLGQRTDSVMFLEGFRDMEQLNGMRKILEIKDAENAYLSEQLEIALTSIEEFNRRFIQGPASELSAAQIALQLNQQQPMMRQ